MIEELDDVIESLADQIGRYGCHVNEDDAQCKCRVCFTSELRERILRAAEVEALLRPKP